MLRLVGIMIFWLISLALIVFSAVVTASMTILHKHNEGEEDDELGSSISLGFTASLGLVGILMQFVLFVIIV